MDGNREREHRRVPATVSRLNGAIAHAIAVDVAGCNVHSTGKCGATAFAMRALSRTCALVIRMVRSTAAEQTSDAQAERRSAVVFRGYRRSEPVHRPDQAVALDDDHIFAGRKVLEGDLSVCIRRPFKSRPVCVSRDDNRITVGIPRHDNVYAGHGCGGSHRRRHRERQHRAGKRSPNQICFHDFPRTPRADARELGYYAQMTKAPQGHKRPADVIGNAVHVMRIATDVRRFE